MKDILTLNGTTRAVAIYNPTDSNQDFLLNVEDVDLDGKVKVRDVFTQQDLPAITTKTMKVSVPLHDTRIFVLKGKQHKQRTNYEAETAWLQRFQNIGKNNTLGYAQYSAASYCSGGAKVEWLGNHEDNYMEWRNVFSQKEGDYIITLSYVTDEDRSLFFSVNGGEKIEIKTPGKNKNEVKTVSMSIRLKKGMNTIRIANPHGWCPDIDKITITKK